MKELLDQLDSEIYVFECFERTVSFALYFRKNGMTQRVYWNGEFTKPIELKSYSFPKNNLKSCHETEFMKTLSYLIKKYSEQFEEISFVLGISNDNPVLCWDMFVWNGEYKYVGKRKYTTRIIEK